MDCPTNPTLITIDGPAGAGKSTIAKAVAKRLKIMYLDTGAMYRALTLKAVRLHLDLEDEQQLALLAQTTQLDLRVDAQHHLSVFVDGQDVTRDIRSTEVTNKTFYLARLPAVREVMVAQQRAIGATASLVAEGRDIGTVVFPRAKWKFYIDADFEERAKRRFMEMQAKGEVLAREAVQQDLQERDTKDLTRSVGPLKKADDAILIDSTHLSIEQVIERIMAYIDSHG